LRQKYRARPGKEKNMTAVFLAMTRKKHRELKSSFNYLGCLSMRSYKAKKNCRVIV
jgi:hypothetical protein